MMAESVVQDRAVSFISMHTMSFRSIVIALVAVAAAASTLFADRITLSDGSVINGVVKSIAGGKAVIATDFAGEITIDQSKIARLGTAEPVNVATQSDDRLLGAPVSAGEAEAAGLGTAIALPPAGIKFLWRDGMADPTLPPPPPSRKWDGEVSLDINGKTGNTEKFNGGIGFKANLAGPSDTLKLYASATYDRENHVTGTRKYLGGADYERKIAGTKNTWYTKAEFEKQPTSGLRLRSEAGAGYGYYAIDRERTKLRFRGGLSGKTRKYTDGTHDDAVGMELTAHFEQLIQEWGKWVTDLTWQPAFDDIHDYRVVHESSLDIPVLFKYPMSLRLGVSNEYNSRTAADAERMETTYFAKMVFKWK